MFPLTVHFLALAIERYKDGFQSQPFLLNENIAGESAQIEPFHLISANYFETLS